MIAWTYRCLSAVVFCACSFMNTAGHAQIVMMAPEVLSPRQTAVHKMLRADKGQLDALQKKLGVPGLVAGVIVDGKLVWAQGVGHRDVGLKAPMTPQTIGRIGSVTKVFTGLAVLRLVEKGKLDLDDPVERYVPELKGIRYPRTDSSKIRVKHLLNHSSGLPRLGGVDYVSRPKVPVPWREVAQRLKGMALKFEPGSQVEYSNLAMAIAGRLVSKAGKTTYQAAIASAILKPLGMVDTLWSSQKANPKNLAKGYQKTGAKWSNTPPWNLGVVAPAGGLYSSVVDLSKFVIEHQLAWSKPGLTRGPVSAKTIRASHLRSGGGFGGGNQFGVNWIVQRDAELGHLLAHTGATFTYSATVQIAPRLGLGAIVMTNGGSAETMAIAQGISRAALGLLKRSAKVKTGAKTLALDPRVKMRIESVLGLIQKPSLKGVEQVFAPQFLKQVKPEILTAMFGRVAKEAGRCRFDRTERIMGKNGAVVRLVCDNARAQLLVGVEESPPHRIGGFSIKPLPK